MKKIKTFAFFSLFLLLALCLTSCQKTLGYGVLLWDIEKYNLKDGSILKVFIKSNIMKQYVAALPGTQEKIEIPLWQISLPVSHKKALALKAQYLDYERTYAKVKLDGLPVRVQTVNTAKQVYRLKKDEVVRVLQKTTGQAVMAGQKALEGDWLKILTKDGTQGYCFSYNLALFKKTSVVAPQEQKDTQGQEQMQIVDLPDNIKTLFWYAKDTVRMIQSQKIDIAALEKSPITPAFFCGNDTKDIYFRVDNTELFFKYSGVHKQGEAFKYSGDVPLKLYIENNTEITAVYTTERKNYTLNLIGLAQEIDTDSLIQKEKQRRQQDFNAILQKGVAFSSDNYGKIRFSFDGGFVWKNYKALVPALIQKTAKGHGSVEAKYYISEDLRQQWDGVLSFYFEDTQNDTQKQGNTKEVNFLYKLQDQGIKLKSALAASITGVTMTQVPNNNLVLFFSYD